MLLIDTISTFESKKNQNVMMRPSFQILSNIFSSFLSLRQRILQIYVFNLKFSFFNFEETSFDIQKFKVISSDCPLSFEKKQVHFGRLNVLVVWCAANKYSETTHFFEKINKKDAMCQELRKLTLLLKSFLIETVPAFESKTNQNAMK